MGAGDEGEGEVGEERGGEEASTQSLKALKDIQSWDSALCDITGAGWCYLSRVREDDPGQVSAPPIKTELRPPSKTCGRSN